MLTTLICTKCSTACAVTSRSVVLPFVCDSCLEPETKQEYSDMAPTPAAEPCGCDTASVEATTKLIEDLQQQLEIERQNLIAVDADKTQANERIAELEMQLLEAKDEHAKTVASYAGALLPAAMEVLAIAVENKKLKDELAQSQEFEERSYRACDRLLKVLDDKDDEIKRLRQALQINMKTLFKVVIERNQWRKRAVTLLTGVSDAVRSVKFI